MHALFLHGDLRAPDVRLEPLVLDALPEGEVLIRAEWSSLNYKYALAITGKGRIVKGKTPFVPGIDVAGVVETSTSPEFHPGQPVLVTGWGLGESRWGGLASHVRMPASQVVPLPEGLSTWQAMAYGTAGFTAALAVLALQRAAITPEVGPLLVTGATGGVGSWSVWLLSQLGYAVTAATGKAESHAYLKGLGASEVVGREETTRAVRPLEAGRFAGGIDSVGGDALAWLLAHTQTHGAVAACGLAASAELHTTVMPFILRGVSLLGIDSNTCPMPLRNAAWELLARFTREEQLRAVAHTIALHEVVAVAQRFMEGRVQGRYVVNVREN